jgi:hypothetical protein
MKGLRAGGTSKPEDPEQKTRLLNTLLDVPSIEAAYRQWSKGRRDDYGYDGVPEGDFADYREKYDTKDHSPQGSPVSTYNDTHLTDDSDTSFTDNNIERNFRGTRAPVTDENKKKRDRLIKLKKKPLHEGSDLTKKGGKVILIKKREDEAAKKGLT